VVKRWIVICLLAFFFAACATAAPPVQPTSTLTLTVPTVEQEAMPAVAPSQPVLTWQRRAGDQCQTVSIDAQSQARFGPCSGPHKTGHILPEVERPLDLQHFLDSYRSFEAETPAGQITLAGHGKQVAAPSEQRAIAEWAGLVEQELEFGRSGASWGLAVALVQEGTNPCSKIQIQSYGMAYADDCSTGIKPYPRRWLMAEQLTQLYQWQDKYAGFELDWRERDVPVRLVFGGTGQEEAPDYEQQRILDWTRSLYRSIQDAQLPTPTLSAKRTPGTDAIISCDRLYPGLPSCLRENALATGRLAFQPRTGKPMVIDLGHGGAWTMPDSTAGLSFSPSGEFVQLSGSLVARFDGTEPHTSTLQSLYTFWAPLNALPGAEEWLAGQMPDGGVVALPVPIGSPQQVLPTGALGQDGRGTVIWSATGALAWTRGTDDLVQAKQWQQRLEIGKVGSYGAQEYLLSADIRNAYYLPLGWAPGTRLILAGQGATCNSCWSWGVPLVSINADNGKITDLHAAMMLMSEAYAWNPKQPGLIAIAEGGSRYRFDVMRLMLLDVITGKQRYLTDDKTSAFEPAWSPDGKLIAYASVRATPNATGDGASLEHTLDGRAIYVVNPSSGETRALTHPGQAMDGWPHRTADGTRLLYARKYEDHTEVRVVSLDGKTDELLVTGLPTLTCYYGGCNWSQILAYHPLP
jgi:WD40-like Beta Propeller Repeat